MDISNLLSQSAMLYAMLLMFVTLISAAVTVAAIARSKTVSAIAGIIFIASGIGTVALGNSASSDKYESAHEVLSSYGITMDGESAYNLLSETAKQEGLREFSYDEDGEWALYKLDVKNKHLTVFQQVDADYVELEPVQ